ncbi:MAG: hypothetical protein K2X41_01915 [Hyphomicrobium sp.]|nr:hypothetical protein [Hyphomicrobium sp.]
MSNDTNDRDGWKAVAKDVSNSADAQGFFAILLILIRHPVSETLKLADDPTYRDHVKFFSACFGVWLAFGLVGVPRVVTWYTGDAIADTGGKATVLALTILQYLELLISIPLSFYLYRLGATVQRTPRSYFKFSMIGAGLALLLSVAMQSIRVGSIIAIRQALPEETALAIVQDPALIALVNVVVMAAPVILAIVLNRAFWRLRWRFVVPVALVILAIDVSALLAAIAVLSTDGAQSLISTIADVL